MANESSGEAHEVIVGKAEKCIESHAKQAIAVSFIPFISLPIVYGVCAKMIVQLDKIFGIPTAKGWDSEILNDILAGIVAAPALAIPVLGAGVASSYIKSIGESYATAVAEVVRTSTPQELSNAAIISPRVKEELQKIYTKQREKRKERMKSREMKAGAL
jgi:uncharacterized protein (DUF697 family)